MRQIFLDTETTGLDPKSGHKIIEIAAVEMVNRQVTDNQFHVYLNPEREIDEAAQEVHGLTLDFLSDKPLFKDIANDFMLFIKDSELVIHNAPFDLSFLNTELQLIGYQTVESFVDGITDSLVMARSMRPGQRNSLDALCKAYGVDNSERSLHGALLDSRLLAEVFVSMTRGQEALEMNFTQDDNVDTRISLEEYKKIPIIKANSDEIKLHQAYIEKIKKS
jgi:DNA polymerase-3 subunit epsilon